MTPEQARKILANPNIPQSAKDEANKVLADGKSK